MSKPTDAARASAPPARGGDSGPSAPARAGIAWPLSAKILTWFCLNLVFIAVVAVVVAQGQFRFGLDSLLTGGAGERLQALSEAVVGELGSRGRDEWSGVLKRFADAYSVRMAVVQNDGRVVAGEIPDIPPAIRAKLPPPPERPRIRDAGPPRDRPEERPFRGPPDSRPGQPANRFPDGRPGPGSGPPEQFPPEGRPQGRPPATGDRGREVPLPPRPEMPKDRFPGAAPREGPPPPNPPPIDGGFPKFIQRVDGAFPYWIGVRTPILERGARPGPTMILLLAIPSLGTGGLLLDYTPWLWIGAGLFVCSVLFWVPLVRGITRSIKQMTGAAGEMARGQFDARVDSRRRDELGQLGESLNHMAGRLGEYLTGQKRFLGDIAHELCSPLARMEMALGVLEQQSGEKQQAYVNDVREEVRHMSSLVNELLSFSKAGLRPKEIALSPVPLAALCHRVAVREASGKQDITVDVDPGLSVLAEPELLARAIGNVIRNSVRYAGSAGPITLGAVAKGETVQLAISDSGPGVPEGVLHRLFDPFFRPEDARTREGGGTGLGLAIVKTCVEACGGSVAVQNRKGGGLRVDITLRAVG
jgi:two-component system sensor histidine kinase CpxA